MHHLSGVLGALEHHMLKKMREPAAAARLEPETNVVIDAQSRHRCRAVGRNDHAKSVFKLGRFEGNVELVQRRSLIRKTFSAASCGGQKSACAALFDSRQPPLA